MPQIIGNIKQITRIERVLQNFTIANGTFIYPVYTCPANRRAKIRLELVYNNGANLLHTSATFFIRSVEGYLNSFTAETSVADIEAASLGFGQSRKVKPFGYYYEKTDNTYNSVARPPTNNPTDTGVNNFNSQGFSSSFYDNAYVSGLINMETREITLMPNQRLDVQWTNFFTQNINGTVLVYNIIEESV